MKTRILALAACVLAAAVIVSYGCGGGGSDSTQPHIAAISKTSSTTAGTTTISLTFTFSGDMSLYEQPTVTVGEVAQASISANVASSGPADCSFDSAGTTFTCTIDIDNCRELHDYSVSVSGATDENGNAVAFVINSADDEFDDSDSLSNCWDQSGTQFATPTIESGTLQWAFHENEEEPDIASSNISKAFTAIDAFAMTMRVIENAPVGFDLIGLELNPTVGELNEAYRILTSGSFGDPPGQRIFAAMVTNTDDAELGLYIPSEASGVWGTVADYMYFCVVKRDLAFEFYASQDGMNFVQMTAANTDEVGGEADPTDIDAVWPGYYAPILRLFAYTSDFSSGYDPQIDYIRFKTKNLAGTSADCPAVYLP